MGRNDVPKRDVMRDASTTLSRHKHDIRATSRDVKASYIFRSHKSPDIQAKQCVA